MIKSANVEHLWVIKNSLGGYVDNDNDFYTPLLSSALQYRTRALARKEKIKKGVDVYSGRKLVTERVVKIKATYIDFEELATWK